MHRSTAHRSATRDRFGHGFGQGGQAVAVSWLLFAALLGLVAVGTALGAEAAGAMLLGIANAAAGLRISRHRRRDRPSRPPL